MTFSNTLSPTHNWSSRILMNTASLESLIACAVKHLLLIHISFICGCSEIRFPSFASHTTTLLRVYSKKVRILCTSTAKERSIMKFGIQYHISSLHFLLFLLFYFYPSIYFLFLIWLVKIFHYFPS